MRTSSAKAKGRRACQEFAELILLAFPELEPDDVRVTPSGCTGEDLLLSPKARALFPFAIEAKNQESLNIWAALKQAEEHASCHKDGRMALLTFKRNRSNQYVAMLADDFFKLIKRRG